MTAARLLVMIVMLSVGALAQTPSQAPVRDVSPAAAAPAPTGTGSLSGTAVNAENINQPVRSAYIVIIGAVTGTLRVTSTDASGRFSVTNLAPDNYIVGASKAPYLGTVAGSKRPGRSGTPIAVADGQRVTGVTIRMPLGAAISGMITDERGQPGANVTVVLRQWRMQNGERTLVSAAMGSTNTDERGRYRFFGLPPGEYIVAAQGFSSTVRVETAAEVDAAIKTGAMPAAPVRPAMRSAPVYFPGTTRADNAGPVVLAASEDRQGIDFKLEQVAVSRLQGVVNTADGQPITQVSITLATSAQSLLSQIMQTTSVDNRFAFPVAPGTYNILARGTVQQAQQFASAVVEINGADQNVELTLRPPIAIKGKLQFDSAGQSPALENRRMTWKSMATNPSNIGAPVIGSTNATGAFTVTNVIPGSYLVGGPLGFGPTSDTMKWSLLSVVIDGHDLTDLPIVIDSDHPPKDVTITYTDRWQGLTGKLTKTGAPAADYTVIAFPADKNYWLTNSRRIVTTRPATDGRYVLSGPGPSTLPPGEYLIAAVMDLDRDEQFDPAFLATLVPSALHVSIKDGERKGQDLVIK